MIIQEKPELGLQKHQQDAYQSVQKAYETKDKASVVIPTGCGKSFIALQLMVDNKDKRIIYLQQLGRALSSDTSREKTIVFDLVNNYLKNNLDAEINRKRNNRNHRDNDDIDGGHEDGPQDDIEDIDIFRIQGETKDFLELLNEAQGIIDRSSYLTNARAIKAWIEQSGGTKPPSARAKDKEEKRLGIALRNIRQVLIKPYMSLETEEEKEKFREEHPEIEEVLDIISELDMQCGTKKQQELATLIK